MLSGGIRYGHEWIWHLVKLVNAGDGSSGWDGSGCQWDDLTGGWTEVWRFGASAANHPSPSGDGGDEVIAIGIIKNKNYFFNMKCKDVLDMKLPVAGENEIA